MPEGAELTLTCSAGIQSEQLTHLSIMFGKRLGSEAGGEVSTVREIISIDKLMGVVPGRLYKKRYDDGEITLEKRNGVAGLDLYVMKMRAVQPDDTGSYFCEASQWIRDQDRSWQKIAQRTMDIGNLTVQQLAESLSVSSSPKGEVTLQVGSPLILTCEVLGLPSEVNSGLLVQWMKRGTLSSDGVRPGRVEVEVARMSPDGVVSWGDDLSRASGGSMEKVAEGRYSLKLFLSPAFRLRGVSMCDVLVSAVAQLPRGPLLKRGSTITLICNATVTTTGPAQAQVQWLRWPIPDFKRERDSTSDVTLPDPPVVEKPSLVAALTYDGVAKIYANSSEVSVDRLSAVSYRLRVHTGNYGGSGHVCVSCRGVGAGPTWRLVQHRVQSGVKCSDCLPVCQSCRPPPHPLGHWSLLCFVCGHRHHRDSDLLLYEATGEATCSKIGCQPVACPKYECSRRGRERRCVEQNG
ncbi:Immunoglobulin superfamily member 8 [Larimichthys crocea]|uniref:Uncharacterized protein n=1 Tax=Larimichthys crocea TaxID=215358 RepID=A0ACD3RHV1_LARCR|nr:Immunoglobulin superfamily member 8 [Larimichthys crocea]